MSDYVITFFTHYDAISCARKLKNNAIKPTMSPVPRALSSSCGTCLQFKWQVDGELKLITLIGDDFEQLFQSNGDKYILLTDNRG